MEVGVKVYAEDTKTGTRKHIVSAYFTFIAVDDDGRPQPIRPVIPEIDDERRRFEAAEKRRLRRLENEER